MSEPGYDPEKYAPTLDFSGDLVSLREADLLYDDELYLQNSKEPRPGVKLDGAPARLGQATLQQ